MVKSENQINRTHQKFLRYLIAMSYFSNHSLHETPFKILTTIEVARYITEKGNRDLFYIIITVKYIIIKTTNALQ